LDLLNGAPVRVTWDDVPIPYAPALEEHVTVSTHKIVTAVESVMRPAQV
jgi:pyruvate/2-oxoglutarate/acetoin dehydrogenase E1 component